jgi:hypothetical protein
MKTGWTRLPDKTSFSSKLVFCPLFCVDRPEHQFQGACLRRRRASGHCLLVIPDSQRRLDVAYYLDFVVGDLHHAADFAGLIVSQSAEKRMSQLMKPSDSQIYPAAAVTGIVMPHNWDDNGRVTQIAIYTNKEEVYLVKPNQKEKELLTCINKRVAVEGHILRGNAGNLIVVVNNFSVLAEDADNENDLT